MYDYFLSFVLGSSFLVTLPHLFIVGKLYPDLFSFSYPNYSLLVPLYFGTMNVLGLYLGRLLNLDLRYRLLLVSLISISLVMCFNLLYSRHYLLPYKNFSTKDWIMYLIVNGSLHLLIFNIIIFSLEKAFT